MKISILSIAIISAFSTSAVQAGNIDPVMPGHQHAYNPDGEFGTINNPPGQTYYSDFYFTLEKLVELSVSAGVNSNNAMASNNNTFSLYTYNEPSIMVYGGAQMSHVSSISPVLLGNFSYGTLSTPHNFGVVGPGAYFYELTGSNKGMGTDQVAFQSHVTPVPEPETYAMLFAGLGVLGFVASRRNNN